MSLQRRSFPPFAAALFLGASLTGAQTLTEYGHLTAGAAKGAGALRSTAPVDALAKVKGRLSRPRAFESASLSPVSTPSQAAKMAPPNLLTVVRTDWGSDASRPASAPPSEPAKTTPSEVVLEVRGADRFNPADAGLEAGMEIAEVSKILGDPSIRTAGLAGRGYDEKAIYQLPTGWRITVFASHGRAREFVGTREGEKSVETLLPRIASVIP